MARVKKRVRECRGEVHRRGPLATAPADRRAAVDADEPVCRRLVAIPADNKPLVARRLSPVDCANVVTRFVVARVEKLQSPARPVPCRTRAKTARRRTLQQRCREMRETPELSLWDRCAAHPMCFSVHAAMICSRTESGVLPSSSLSVLSSTRCRRTGGARCAISS